MYHIRQEVLIVDSSHHQGEIGVIVDAFDDNSYIVEFRDGAQEPMLENNLAIGIPSWESIYIFTGWIPEDYVL